MDNIDRKILNIIQKNAKTSNAEIARRIGMAPSGILERIKKLESSGLIQSYEARINHKMLGLALTTFILLDTDEHLGNTGIGTKLAKIPELQEVHSVTGEYSYLVKARVKDSDHHNELLRRMGKLGVKNARTTMVLETIKETLNLDSCPEKEQS